MKIFIATDHRGVDIEDKIVKYLEDSGIETIRTNIKHHSLDDYPDFAFDVSKNVINNDGSYGILICGTGIGMSIAANKVKGIRAARCVDVNDAYYARSHNSCNVLCLSMETSYATMCEIIDTFLHTKNPDEEKHINRVNKIIDYENGAYNGL